VTAICCDLDGVIWLGDSVIAGAPAAIAQLRAAGHDVVFVTNNSSMTQAEYGEKLTGLGIESDGSDVLTSALAAAALLGDDMPPGATVLTCAGPGVRQALSAKGLVIVDAAPADAVVVGWHRDFDFDDLAAAADAVRAGARFVATNTDPTYPVAGGVLPGTGAIVAAVATAGGRPPDVVTGKPHAAMAALVRARCGDDGIMIGDRVSTDGAFATALGWPFALVLSGIAGQDGSESVPDPPPAFVAPDIAALVPMLTPAPRG
jgi:glycerol 3-phosphatase-2